MTFYVILYITLVCNALASPTIPKSTSTPREPCQCNFVTNLNRVLECKFLASLEDWRNQSCYNVTIDDLNCLENLTVTNSYFRILTASSLANLTHLKVLNITLNHALEEIEPLPRLDALHTLHLAKNNLSKLAPGSFANLTSLRHLNLANNSLTELNGTELQVAWKNLTSLHLAGESLSCSESMEWLLVFKNVLKDANMTWCTVTYSDDSSGDFDDLRYPIIELSGVSKAVNESCPKPCHCVFQRAYMNRTELSYGVNVKCDNRNLTELPVILPTFTTDLSINNNKIANLNLVEDSDTYGSLTVLHVANNSLTSLRTLGKGQKRFLKRYQYLDLPLNDLGEDTTDRTDKEKVQGKMLVLNNITWPCDCAMAQTLTPWVIANIKLLGYHGKGTKPNLFCVREGKKVFIASLVKELECHNLEVMSDPVYTNYYVIAAESILLLLLLLKITYDTWMYFKQGKLPWIATKIP